MHDVIAAAVSIVGGACTLAYVTKLLADVLQPNSSKNTWKNASLTVVGMAIFAAALLAAKQLSLAAGLPAAVQAVAAAMIAFGVLSVIVMRLFDMPLDEVVGAAPVIGTTTGVIGGMLFFALAT